MIPFYWVNGPPNKKREKLSLKNFTHKAWKRPHSKGKKYSFRKGSFPALNRFCHHKEERKEKVLCTKVNYFPYKANGLRLQKRRIFHKVEKKGIPITFSKMFLLIEKGRIV
jgi:hypothetical protein